MAKNSYATDDNVERAYLVAAEVKGSRDLWRAEDSVAELANLARTAGASAAATQSDQSRHVCWQRQSR